MERILIFKKEYLERVPTVVPGDSTGRLQSVSKRTNMKFYNLIKKFHEYTNVPMLVNTSFNVAGEPVVCTPQDAIKTFFTSGLDILVLGNYIIKKE